jgi:hypothetical protein
MTSWGVNVIFITAVVCAISFVVFLKKGIDLFFSFVLSASIAFVLMVVGVTIAALVTPRPATFTGTVDAIVHHVNAVPPPSNAARARHELARFTDKARFADAPLSLTDATTKYESPLVPAAYRFNMVSRKAGKVACVTYSVSTTLWMSNVGMCP